MLKWLTRGLLTILVLAMIAAAGLGALLWSVLHSYLLLVRFSAIAIMRRNVIEV